MKHSFWLLTGLLLLAGALLSPQVWAQEPEQAAKIGVLLPLSGPHKALGAAALDAIQWANQEQYELVLIDSGGEPEAAAAGVDELAAMADLPLIIGPVGAQESKQAAAAAEQAQIPLISLSSAYLIEERSQYVMRARVAAEEQAQILGQLAVDKLERRRAAVFFPDDDYGWSSARAFAAAFVAAGGEIDALEPYDPEESKPDDEAELLANRRIRRLQTKGRPSSKARRIKGEVADFDTLFIPDSGPNVQRSLSFISLAGISLDTQDDLLLLGTSAWASGSLGGEESLAGGALVSVVFDAEGSEHAAAESERFVAEFGHQPTDFEAQIYEATLLAMMALERCHELDRRCVLQGLLSGRKVQGLNGERAFSRQGLLQRALLVFSVDQLGELLPF